VKKAIIDPVADFIKLSPTLKDATAVPNPPGPGLSCLRSFFFFEQEDPALFTTNGRTWWIENIREVYYSMDKEYSRVVSKLAFR